MNPLGQIEPILPYYSDAKVKRPHFYEPTDTVYNRLNWHEVFQQRGIYNPTLTSLTSALPPGAIIAGGFISSLLRGGDPKPSDIDIFFTNDAAFEATFDLFSNPPEGPGAWAFREYASSVTKEAFLDESGSYKLVRFDSPNPERLPVQLIKMVWYNNAEHVIDSFDFTVCQFAVDASQLVYNPLGMMDLFKGRLVAHRHHYPADTLYRLIKYAKKGFHASPMSLIKIATDIRNAEESDPPTSKRFYE